MDPRVEPSVYLTADVPPVGGVLRERPEDFFVEELPLYEPSGRGEHLYLFVEKRNLTTTQAIAAIARHFRVPHGAVGYAGLKDKRAVTRQLFSVHLPGKSEADFPAFEHDRMAILWMDRHENKLRRGHLAGNRFVIRIRGVDATKVVHAHRVLRTLERTGVPNRAGEQRFGYLGRNHEIGRALLLGEHRTALDLLLGPCEAAPEWQAEARRLYAERKYEAAREAFPPTERTERRALAALAKGDGPKRAIDTMDELQRRYYITAFQSAIFNALLDDRLAAGALGSLEEGDLAWKHDSGAVFPVTADELASGSLPPRLAALEISPSGPMWGADMTRASGPVGERELAALTAVGVTPGDLVAYGERTGDRVAVQGARRPMRVPLRYPDAEGGVDERGHYIRCVFELPRGAFATVVMREIMKPELAGSPPLDVGDED